MILSTQTQIKIRAMLAEMTKAEVLERLDVPEYTLDAALRGEDVPKWEGDNIFEGCEAWDVEQSKGAA